MTHTLAVLVGLALGITVTIYSRRYAGSFLWWAFSRGDS